MTDPATSRGRAPMARRAAVVAAVALAAATALTVSGHGATAAEARSPERRPTAAAPAAALPEPVQRLDIVGTEYSFEISPDPARGLKPGWTEVRFENVGGEAHQVMFAAPKPGVDLATLAQAGSGDSSGASAIEFVNMLGGVSYIGSGHEATAMVDLPEGIVLAMCFVPDPNGVAHALHGMSAVLMVSGADGAAPNATAAPGGKARSRKAEKVRGTIELAADGYRIPKTLPAGWYLVKNTDRGEPGKGLHELSVLRLQRAVRAPGVREIVDDLAVNATPSVGIEALGGMGAISPGFEGYVRLDLPSGNYLAVDFMPDPGVPTPHMVDGYYATFRP
ncbi:MAG: hypothetical protein FJW95_14710 [Actinobacteria bacterium]|nr:hypothetical protein [Actinomycetota bacterium]